MPNNYRYTEGFPAPYRQRVSDVLDLHDSADRRAAVKKAVLNPTGVTGLVCIGFAGLFSITIPPLLFITVPLVYEAYKVFKYDFEDALDDIKLVRMHELDVQIYPEVVAEIEAYREVRASNDEEPFHFPPDYIELSAFPPSYDENAPRRAGPLPGNVKETSF